MPGEELIRLRFETTGAVSNILDIEKRLGDMSERAGARVTGAIAGAIRGAAVGIAAIDPLAGQGAAAAQAGGAALGMGLRAAGAAFAPETMGLSVVVAEGLNLIGQRGFAQAGMENSSISGRLQSIAGSLGRVGMDLDREDIQRAFELERIRARREFDNRRQVRDVVEGWGNYFDALGHAFLGTR